MGLFRIRMRPSSMTSIVERRKGEKMQEKPMCRERQRLERPRLEPGSTRNHEELEEAREDFRLGPSVHGTPLTP